MGSGLLRPSCKGHDQGWTLLDLANEMGNPVLTIDRYYAGFIHNSRATVGPADD